MEMVQVIGAYFNTDLIEEQKKRKVIPYQFKQLNDLTDGGSCLGDLVVLVGDTGLGKSTLATQMVGDFWRKHNYKTLIYSGEMDVESVINDLSIQQSFKGKDENCYIASVLSVEELEEMAKQDFKVFLVDNLMTMCSFSSDLYNEQSRTVKELKRIAQEYNCLIILIAHPNKTKAARTENNELTIESISGSANIGNLANLILGFNRGSGEDQRMMEVLKNRKTGHLGKINLYYTSENKRYWEEF